MPTPLYGFHNLEHVFDQRVTEAGVSVVADAIEQALAEHNRQINALRAIFAETTTEFKVNFKTSTVTRNQPLDQDGRARPIQPSGEYEVAFPLQGSGNAFGANFRARQKLTVSETNRILTALLVGDIRWMRDHILAALFLNTTWTFKDDIEGGGHGDLTIKGPANGDTDTYEIIAGADQAATDDHFKAQLNSIADGADDPFESDFDDLMEHPENQGDAVALVPTNLKTSIKGLADFHPVADDNIQRGSGSDVLTGSLGVALPGEVFGYHDSGVWLAEWRSLPDNYYVMFATQGERALRMRQEPEPSLQGFVQVAEREDYPFWESQYLRYAGFGAWNRVGVVVRRIGNASYAIPTNYTSPMR